METNPEQMFEISPEHQYDNKGLQILVLFELFFLLLL